MDWQKQSLICQKEWSRVLCSWKRFKKPDDDDLIKTYIGIGLFGFTEAVDPEHLSLRSYYNNYTTTQRSRIQTIVDKLVQSNKNEITLGHTYLYLNENGIVYCIFRCWTKTNVIFIEPTGRAYNSWTHFLETNQLPYCKFLAPKNGVYGKTVDIVCYQSSSSKQLLDKSQNVMDWVCAMAGIGCTLLGVFSVAPGVVASTAIAIGMRNLHKSVANILDQNEHQQLTSLSTVNSGISLASIAASALASTVSKSCEIISLAGEQSGLALKILQSLNIPNKLINTGCFGTYLLHLCYRMQKGKISNIDALELAGQLFILYGAVVDVFSLHQVIVRERLNTRRDLAVQFNEWKRRLQKDYVRVENCEPLIALKLLSSRSSKISFQILRKFYSKDEVFLNACFDTEHFTLDYLCDRISLNQYCAELRPLVLNLWTLLHEDFDSVTNIVYPYLHHNCTDVAISKYDYEDISKLLLDAVPTIKKIEDESRQEKLPTNKHLDTFSEVITDKHKIIIDTASFFVKKDYLYNSIGDIIAACYNAIVFTTSKITEITNQSYDEIVAYNRNIVRNEGRLQVILERVNASTVDQYFHNDRAFSNVINKFRQDNKSLPGMIPALESPFSDQLIREICKEVMMIYEEAYVQVTNSLQFSIYDTMNVLQNISLLLNEKLISEMDSIRSQSISYSQMNAVLGEAGADNTFDVTELKELSVIREAKARLKINEILSDFQFSNNSAIELNPRTEKTDHQMVEALTIICSNFYQRVKDIFDAEDRTLIVRKIFYFIITKFVDTMNTCSKDEQARKVLIDRERESKLIMAICASSESLFYAVLEKFDDDRYINELTAQLFDFLYDDCSAYNKLPIYREVIASNEFQLRCIKCRKHQADEFYKSTASVLFDIDVNDEYDIVINFNSVFLKSVKKLIVFNFVNNDDDVTLVFLLNLKLNTI